MQRVSTIDFTRGLVMVIMALDHVRDMFHTPALDEDPTNLQTTTAVLFMTRWVTHLCAPTFVFLSGTSAYLSARSSGDVGANRRFLATRGLWLLLLEFTLVNLGLWFNLRFAIIALQVIGAIGAGMLVLAALMPLKPRTIGAIGLLIVFGHNLLQGVNVGESGVANVVWSVLFRPGVFPVSPQFTFFVMYPVVPWVGILLAGYGCGPVFTKPLTQRRRVLLGLGKVALGLFAVVRLINLYGDPAGWSLQQRGLLFTFLSFINCTKYPPSLLYVLMTLGVSFLILATADGRENGFTRIVSVYGKVPLFYYLIHWYLIHILAVGLAFAQGFRWADLPFGAFEFGRPHVGYGFALPGVYLVWLVVVAALYPLCRWYGRYKAAHREMWVLRYL